MRCSIAGRCIRLTRRRTCCGSVWTTDAKGIRVVGLGSAGYGFAMADGDEYSVEAARKASERDELGAWVSRFLVSPGSDNPILAEELSERHRFWIGPVRLPLSRLQRLAGPPE